MNVKLIQIDGKMPNLALMRLASWHRAQGDTVHLTTHSRPDLFEPAADRVYASSIFRFSAPKIATVRAEYPEAIMGGTGISIESNLEGIIGDYAELDYSIYPEFQESIGFTQKGCRLKCSFCVVPKKEGANRTVATAHQIWRGPGHPRKLMLLDNDFFGQPREQWKERIREFKEGGFKVNFHQGINIRLIDEEGAAALATIKYYSAKFDRRSLHTAWDNMGDERIFFKGVETLKAAGVPPRHLVVYMLIGYRQNETMAELMDRFWKITNLGAFAYPMNFDKSREELNRFQRWAIRRYFKIIPWEKFTKAARNEYETKRRREKNA